MRRIAENLWTLHYPLSLLGGHQDRIVTIIRLATGQLLIHSTGPFTPADIAAITNLGTPAWIVDSMLRHDTFSQQGRDAFPTIPYLAPEGFADATRLHITPLLPTPPEWAGEIKVLEIAGMPKVREHVFLHIPTRTLIVADLVFNFHPTTGWTSFFRRHLMGVKTSPDSARLYPLQIHDRPAYDRSINELLTWDFTRIIVGHNAVVETNAKPSLKTALANKGMLPANA